MQTAHGPGALRGGSFARRYGMPWCGYRALDGYLHPLCGRSASRFVILDATFVARITWNEKHGSLIAIGKHALSGDFSTVIDKRRLRECESRTWGNKHIQVGHTTVFPQEGALSRCC